MAAMAAATTAGDAKRKKAKKSRKPLHIAAPKMVCERSHSMPIDSSF